MFFIFTTFNNVSSHSPYFFSSSLEAEAVNNNFSNVYYLIKEIEACKNTGVKR